MRGFVSGKKPRYQTSTPGLLLRRKAAIRGPSVSLKAGAEDQRCEAWLTDHLRFCASTVPVAVREVVLSVESVAQQQAEIPAVVWCGDTEAQVAQHVRFLPGQRRLHVAQVIAFAPAVAERDATVVTTQRNVIAAAEVDGGLRYVGNLLTFCVAELRARQEGHLYQPLGLIGCAVVSAAEVQREVVADAIACFQLNTLCQHFRRVAPTGYDCGVVTWVGTRPRSLVVGNFRAIQVHVQQQAVIEQ